MLYFRDRKMVSIRNIGPVTALISDNKSTETPFTVAFLLKHYRVIYKAELVKGLWWDNTSKAETIHVISQGYKW